MTRRSAPASVRRRAPGALALLALLLPALGGSADPGPWKIPDRPAGAVTGSEFARATIGLEGRLRQEKAVAEILSGNVPPFLRNAVPVEIEGTLGGRTHRVTLLVSPDYLAIGTDEDFLRMPLTRPSASRVALAFDAALPTPRIVDAIYDQATVRLRPAPLPPGPQMRSSRYFLRHRRLVEDQRQAVHGPVGELTAGHKKDVVLARRLVGRPDRIAIYGWHRGEEHPIQPLSLVHGSRYADYSHGIRLVATTVLVDGSRRSFWEVLADPALAPLISDEGPIPEARALLRAEVASSSAAAPGPLARSPRR